MFERYTEKARRIIFFARYEASQQGATQIEPEHLLLGLLREDPQLLIPFLRYKAGLGTESIRQEIMVEVIHRVSSSGDLPLSSECKRVLAFAAEESNELGTRHIGSAHLLLGLLRAENSKACEVLLELGIQISEVRQYILEKESDKPQITQIIRHEFQPAELGEEWMDEVLKAGIEHGVLTQADFMNEFNRVAALRQFRADVEALLRLLAARGLVDPQSIAELAFDLRDKIKLALFIEKLRNTKQANNDEINEK